MPRTRRVDCSGPGFRRARRGRGFSYHSEDGERITDPDAVDRIRSLAIPPAWTDVWICADPRGHVQATGIDAAGRKQYRYHDDWREHRDRIKFEEMLDFARKLPKLRVRVDEGLGRRGLGFDRVCSCAVALLDLGLFRVGGDRLDIGTESYGLTTIRCRHLSFANGEAVFSYPSKSGQRSKHRIGDARVMGVLKALKKQGKPGDELLGFREGREWRDINADHVNGYIKEVVGNGFSAKDFRTWNATVLTAIFLAAEEEAPKSKAARKRIVNRAVEETARYLNNTPAVCRSAYIDPRVFDRFDSGATIRASMGQIEARSDPGEFADREAIERAVIRLLD